ncbi:MAG: efflux RND transporter permease subunit [Gemmataceae bacterium]|nr:efflux RND transporter permease subunit [Gemmataceae bacterium]
MLDGVIRLALCYRGPVLLAAAVLMAYGGYLATTLPIDVFPDLDRPRVVLLTECPGLSPEEIEALVAQPIETALLGAPGVQAVRSRASQGVLITYAEFGWGTEIRDARQVVQERLAMVAGSLPPGIRPLMTPPTSIMGQILHAGLYRQRGPGGGSLAPVGRTGLLAERVETNGKPELAVWRPADRHDPATWERVPVEHPTWADRTATFTLAGKTQSVTFRTPGQERMDLRAAADGVVRPRLLREPGVAEVIVLGGDRKQYQVLVHPDRLLDYRVTLPDVDRAIGENNLNASGGFTEEGPVERPARVIGRHGPDPAKVLDDLRKIPVRAGGDRPVLLGQVATVAEGPAPARGDAGVDGQDAVVVTVVKQPHADTRAVTARVTAALREAEAALPADAVVTVGLFQLKDFIDRGIYYVGEALVIGAGLVVVVLFLFLLNFRTTVITLTAIPLPLVVTAVVFRLAGLSVNVMTLGGGAVAMGELVDAAIVDVENISRRLRENAASAAPRTGDGFLLRALKWAATFLIRFSLRYAGVLLLLTWVVVAYCGWRLTTLGADFLPPFDEGSVQLNVSLPAGSSLRASNEVAALIDAKLRGMRQTPDNPGGDIRHFVRRTGRAELDEHAEPVGRSEYILSLNPDSGRSREEMLSTLLAELREEVPGVDLEAEQPLAHLISHMLSGVTAPIAIKIYGDDLDRLQAVARQVKAAIEDIPGLTPPVIDPQETVDELHVVLRPDDLARYGLSREAVARVVETALKGEVVSRVVDGPRRFDLVVKLDAPYRTDYHRLGELRIDLPGGKGQVRLKDVADLPEGAGGPNQVNRENARRRAVVRCNVRGRDLGGVVADIERRVKARVTLPEGYFVEYGGQFEAQRSATRLIGVLAAVSVAGVFVVLFLLYPSARITLQILNAVPTAFIGGVVALVVTGQTLTVASSVGFVSLGGIAVRNGILLVIHYVHLMKEDGLPFRKETILRGSLERLAPVLMTALTAGIGLVPLVAGGQKPGLEILYPVATVILGGLVTSTLCEFLLHPGLFWKFSGADADRLARGGAGEDSRLP